MSILSSTPFCPKHALRSWLRVPTLCVICQASAERHNLCHLCLADLPRLHAVCHTCALPIHHGTRCGPCLLKPPVWHELVCAAPYSAPFDGLIARLKYHQQLVTAPALAALLVDAIQRRDDIDSAHQSSSNIDLIVPMPLHWTRQVRRGYNQAMLLAQCVGQSLSLSVQPALRRTQRTRSQTTLTPRQRATNVRRAFRVSNNVSGCRIALIDDVVTSGATARAASRCLLEAGARDVTVWACLRAHRSLASAHSSATP
ncbi:MAG: ComF family protein [Pseudomonadota bacterium]